MIDEKAKILCQDYMTKGVIITHYWGYQKVRGKELKQKATRLNNNRNSKEKSFDNNRYIKRIRFLC